VISAARSSLCWITARIHRLNTCESPIPNAAAPNAAASSAGSRRTASTQAIPLRTTTRAMPPGPGTVRRNIGHRANASSHPAGFPIRTTADNATRTARDAVPRRAAACRGGRSAVGIGGVSGRTANRYQGTMAASATLTASLPGAPTGPASTIPAVTR
jgi:hypothetical protein